MPLRILPRLLRGAVFCAAAVLASETVTADEASPPARSRVVIEDSLEGATLGRQVGGDLGPGGFRPGRGFGHIFYSLTPTVREGYAEFEIKGMNPAALPAGADPAFFAMYDGRGIEEPARYFEDFKGNFFRWNVHWRQNRGAVKAVISCAAPTPERLAAARAVYPAERDWTAEPTGAAFAFSPDAWHLVRVEWRARIFRVLIDDTEVWRVEGPHDYAPGEHRIWLGCAPGIASEKTLKYGSVLEGVMFRRFRLVAYESEDGEPGS